MSELRLRRALRRAAHQSARSTAAAASKVAPPTAMPTTRAIGNDIRVPVTSNLQKDKKGLAALRCAAPKPGEWSSNPPKHLASKKAPFFNHLTYPKTSECYSPGIHQCSSNLPPNRRLNSAMQLARTKIPMAQSRQEQAAL